MKKRDPFKEVQRAKRRIERRSKTVRLQGESWEDLIGEILHFRRVMESQPIDLRGISECVSSK